jgi:hypothetical protein
VIVLRASSGDSYHIATGESHFHRTASTMNLDVAGNVLQRVVEYRGPSVAELRAALSGHGVTLASINTLLYRCEPEERDVSGGARGVYVVPGYVCKERARARARAHAHANPLCPPVMGLCRGRASLAWSGFLWTSALQTRWAMRCSRTFEQGRGSWTFCSRG